jgi:hypothetical protein
VQDERADGNPKRLNAWRGHRRGGAGVERPGQATPGVITGVNSESLPPGRAQAGGEPHPAPAGPARAAAFDRAVGGALSIRRWRRHVDHLAVRPSADRQAVVVTSDGKAYRRTNAAAELGERRWDAAPGSIRAPLLNGYLRAAEMNGNLYFNTPDSLPHHRRHGDADPRGRPARDRADLSARAAAARFSPRPERRLPLDMGIPKDANGNVVRRRAGRMELFTASSHDERDRQGVPRAERKRLLLPALADRHLRDRHHARRRDAARLSGHGDERRTSPTATSRSRRAAGQPARRGALHESFAGRHRQGELRPPACLRRRAISRRDVLRGVVNGGMPSRLALAMLGIPTSTR